MEEENKTETGEGGSVYLGNAVPKFLRVTYVAFAVWAVFYIVKNLVPDLMQWLKR